MCSLFMVERLGYSSEEGPGWRGNALNGQGHSQGGILKQGRWDPADVCGVREEQLA